MNALSSGQITLTNIDDTYSILLTNEAQVIPTNKDGYPLSSQSYSTTVMVLQGAFSFDDFRIGEISSANGITVRVVDKTITFTVEKETPLTKDSGIFNVPIIVNGSQFIKTFSWSCSKQGQDGQNGENAKTVSIIASSQVFKSTDGGKTFTPNTIVLTPNLSYVTYSNWQYSTNGGTSWNPVSSGSNGLTIGGNVLTISKDCKLFTQETTAIVFRLNTNDPIVYDTITIVKMYDIVDLTQEDIFNKLTNNGQAQGVYLEDGKIYINGQYIKAGTITGDMITAGTITGNDVIIGGDETNGTLKVLDSTNTPTMIADKNGVYSTEINFVDTLDNSNGSYIDRRLSRVNAYGYRYDVEVGDYTYLENNTLDIFSNILTSSHRLTRNGVVSTSDELQLRPSGITIKNNYGGSTRISANSIEASNVFSTGNVTTGTLIQTNYNLPLEIGKYVDMHQSGSTNDVDVRIEASDRRGIMVKCGNDLSQGTEIGRINNNASFIKNLNGGQFLTMEDSGRLTYDGSTVPHNWRQNFTPFIFSDTGKFNMVESWGEAVYLGDLVWIRGRVTGSRGGHSGSVYIGGLPVSCNGGYPALDIAFFGGVTGNLGNGGFDIRAYLEGNASHCIITYSNKDTGGWHNLQCSHVTTGNMDISFSATYRWR